MCILCASLLPTPYILFNFHGPSMLLKKIDLFREKSLGALCIQAAKMKGKVLIQFDNHVKVSPKLKVRVKF